MQGIALSVVAASLVPLLAAGQARAPNVPVLPLEICASRSCRFGRTRQAIPPAADSCCQAADTA